MTTSGTPLETVEWEAPWLPVESGLPPVGKIVSVRQDRWAPCRAWRTERGEWKFIEYQHPHHVTHWRYDD